MCAPMQATRQSGPRGRGGFLNSLINTRCSLGNIYTDPVPCPSPPSRNNTARQSQPASEGSHRQQQKQQPQEEEEDVVPSSEMPDFFGRTDDVLKNDKTSSVWVYDKERKYESLQRLSDLHHRLQSRDKQPIEISFLKECLEPCWPIAFLVAALSVTDS